MEITFMGFLFFKLYKECNDNYTEVARRINANPRNMSNWGSSLKRGQLVSLLGEALLVYYSTNQTELYQAYIEYHAMKAHDAKVVICMCPDQMKKLRREYLAKKGELEKPEYENNVRDLMASLFIYIRQYLCKRIVYGGSDQCAYYDQNKKTCPCLKIYSLYQYLVKLK